MSTVNGCWLHVAWKRCVCRHEATEVCKAATKRLIRASECLAKIVEAPDPGLLTKSNKAGMVHPVGQGSPKGPPPRDTGHHSPERRYTTPTAHGVRGVWPSLGGVEPPKLLPCPPPRPALHTAIVTVQSNIPAPPVPISSHPHTKQC